MIGTIECTPGRMSKPAAVMPSRKRMVFASSLSRSSVLPLSRSMHASVAETMRADPRGLMRALWGRIGLDWRDEAFDWAREVPEDWQQVGAWHEEASTSSGIRAPDAEEFLRKELDFEALEADHPHLRDYLDHHLPFYRKLAARALQP